MYLLDKYSCNKTPVRCSTEQGGDKQAAGDVYTVGPASQEEEEQKENAKGSQAEFTFNIQQKFVIFNILIDIGILINLWIPTEMLCNYENVFL